MIKSRFVTDLWKMILCNVFVVIMSSNDCNDFKDLNFRNS